MTRNQIDVRAVVPDPAGQGEVETRVLVDGRPVICAAFDKGPAFCPEDLLADERLHATDEPHEVRLAEANCTEDCCSALYVSIVREGDTVVWRDWRGTSAAAPPAELCFDAAQYDAEIARARADHTWEWAARTVARLLRERLRTLPELLARWECRPCWVAARVNEPGQVRLCFSYPGEPSWTGKEPWLQFEQIITVDDAPPAEQTARAISRLEAADPRTLARIVGGNRDSAERLGFPWPERM